MLINNNNKEIAITKEDINIINDKIKDKHNLSYLELLLRINFTSVELAEKDNKFYLLISYTFIKDNNSLDNLKILISLADFDFWI